MVAPGKAEWDVEGQRWKQPSTGGASTGKGVPPPRYPWEKSPGDRDRILRFTAVAITAALLVGGLVSTVVDLAQGWSKEEAAPTEEAAPEEVPEVEDPASEEETDRLFPAEEEVAPDLYEDPEGFALYVPEGWDRSTAGAESGVTYTSTDDERYLLQVMWDQGTSDSSMEVLERRVHNDVSQHGGYEEIRLKETSDGDAEFEYVYDHGTHGPRRVMVTAFDLDGSTTYMVLSVGPEDEGDAIAEVHDEAVSSFCDEDDACRGDV